MLEEEEEEEQEEEEEEEHGGDQSWYEFDLICLNGHVLNHNFIDTPKYCPDCGAKTISQCPHCRSGIPGYSHTVHIGLSGHESIPAYCAHCGEPYPWTETKLKTARELIQLQELWQDLSKVEQANIQKSLNDITQNTPQAIVGATRLNKLLMKVGSVASEVLKQIFIDVASETAKKVLLGK